MVYPASETELADPRAGRDGADEPSAPVLPSHEDAFVAATSHLIGGPVGLRAIVGSRRFWNVWRVLIALTLLTCTLGWAQKAQCRDTRNWSHAEGVYQYTRLCYSDVVALYGSEGLEPSAGHPDGKTPYVDQPVEYPVLIGAVMDLGSTVARTASPSRSAPQGQITEDDRAATFYDVTVLLMALAAVGCVIATGLAAGRRRVWDAALVALAPTVVIHLGTNWDLLAVALATGGIAAWARKRPVLAGLLIGLGAAAKAYPLLFLLPLFLLCLRSGQLRAWGKTVVGAVIGSAGIYCLVWPFSPAFAYDASGNATIVGPSAWQALRAPGGSLGDFVSALAPDHDGGSNGLLRFLQLNRTRTADFDTLWYALQQGLHTTFPTGRLNLAVIGADLLLAGGITALALLAPRRPRLPVLLFVLVAGFLLVNKVDSPQYTLWLLPLAALARPRWRAFLAWQLSEVLLLIVRFGFFVNLSHSDKGAPYGYFFTAVALRDATLVLLIVLMVREALDPGLDVVRAGGLLDDPAGGVFDEAPDRPAFQASVDRDWQPLEPALS